MKLRIARGIELANAKRYGEAETAFRGALELDSRSAIAHHNLAQLFWRQNRLDDARRAYEAALRLDPHATASRVGLGHVFAGKREYRQAVDCYRQALAASPNPPPFELHKGLGMALNALGDRAASIEAYRAALASNPESAEAHFDLAEALLTAGDSAEALALLAHALRLEPESLLARRLHAIALAAVGDTESAIESLKPLARPGTTASDWYVFLGNRLIALGQVESATSMYRKALDSKPGNPIAAHYLAALTDLNPDRASDAYVREFFDVFADNFDDWLSDLEYTVPAGLVDALLAACHPATPWEVLDLGCGTGLVGDAIAPHAGSVVGVDLSSNMLRRAGQRKAYTRLVCAELSSALGAESPSCYDVVTAADVFIYVGNLDSVVPAVRRTLRQGGLFAFSVETLEDEQPNGPYRLRRSGRYAHAAAYLEDLARRNGFEVELVRVTPLRLEANVPITGRVAVWRRNEGA